MPAGRSRTRAEAQLGERRVHAGVDEAPRRAQGGQPAHDVLGHRAGVGVAGGVVDYDVELEEPVGRPERETVLAVAREERHALRQVDGEAVGRAYFFGIGAAGKRGQR